MTPRRVVRGGVLRLCAFGTAAAATVALTQAPASGAFSAVSGNAANSVSSAASFCTAGPTTLYSAGDTWTDESSTSTNHQNNLELRVRSLSGGDRRIWTRFALPTVPARSELVQAKLRLYNKTPNSGRNNDAYRGDPTAPCGRPAASPGATSRGTSALLRPTRRHPPSRAGRSGS